MQHIDPASHFERSTKEYVILCISLAGVVALSPFAIHRIITQDFLIAALDFAAVLAMAGIFFYVYKTGRTAIAAWVLTTLFVLVMLLSISLKGPDQLLWCYPASIGIFYLVSAPKAAGVNTLALISVYLIVDDQIEFRDEAVFVITLISTNVFTFVFARGNDQQKQQLEQLSLKDPLTGALNKRAFDIDIKKLDANQPPEATPTVLVMIDIDYFKRVNDSFGHPKGDEVLTKLASLITVELNQGEKLYRVGGEEFAIFPVAMAEQDAVRYADRIRQLVESSILNAEYDITISVGLACRVSGETLADWVARADTALYTAKRKGRNCVMLSSTEASDPRHLSFVS